MNCIEINETSWLFEIRRRVVGVRRVCKPCRLHKVNCIISQAKIIKPQVMCYKISFIFSLIELLLKHNTLIYSFKIAGVCSDFF